MPIFFWDTYITGLMLTDKNFCQPFIRTKKNNQKMLVLAGNFNIANINQIREWLRQHTTNIHAGSEFCSFIGTYWFFLIRNR